MLAGKSLLSFPEIQSRIFLSRDHAYRYIVREGKHLPSSAPLEMLGIILLTPVLLALLFLPVIVSPRHALSGGLLGFPLPLCGVATGSKILLPLIDEVLDILCEARLQRVNVRIRGRVATVHRYWQHTVQLASGVQI
jgi:hypothetical protein